MLAFPRRAPTGEVSFLGWMKAYFPTKHRKYDGNEKTEHRITCFYGALTKVSAHVASINAEELTATDRQSKESSDSTLSTETIVTGIAY